MSSLMFSEPKQSPGIYFLSHLSMQNKILSQTSYMAKTGQVTYNQLLSCWASLNNGIFCFLSTTARVEDNLQNVDTFNLSTCCFLYAEQNLGNCKACWQEKECFS